MDRVLFCIVWKMGRRSNGLSELWAVGIMLRIPKIWGYLDDYYSYIYIFCIFTGGLPWGGRSYTCSKTSTPEGLNVWCLNLYIHPNYLVCSGTVLYFKDRKQVEIHLFNCLTLGIAVTKLFLKCTKRLMTKCYEKESYNDLHFHIDFIQTY